MVVLCAVLPKAHILVKAVSRLCIAVLTKCEMLALFPSPPFFKSLSHPLSATMNFQVVL